MYSDVITLFCVHDNTWRATVLENVDLNADRSAILARLGTNSADRAQLHVKYKRTDQGIQIADGVYAVGEKSYDGSEDKVTFASGDHFSFFLNGEWDGESTISDNDYPQGFYNYMNETYGEVYAISSVAIYSVIPHFEVMAR